MNECPLRKFRWHVLRLLLVLSFLSPTLNVFAEEDTDVGKEIKDALNAGEAALNKANNFMENCFVHSMPVTVPYIDNGPFSIRLTFDSLRFVRGKELNSVDDDNTLVNVDATFKFPFTVSSDGSNIVRFHGDGIRLEGANATSRISLGNFYKLNTCKSTNYFVFSCKII